MTANEPCQSATEVWFCEKSKPSLKNWIWHGNPDSPDQFSVVIWRVVVILVSGLTEIIWPAAAQQLRRLSLVPLAPMRPPTLVAWVKPLTMESGYASFCIRCCCEEEHDVWTVLPKDRMIVSGEFAAEKSLDGFDYVFVSRDGDRELSAFRILPSHSN